MAREPWGLRGTREYGGRQERTPTFFTVGEYTAPMIMAQEDDPEAGVVFIADTRTKIWFIGNKVDLRNPQMVPIDSDIFVLKEAHGCNECARHTGTPGACQGCREARLGQVHPGKLLDIPKPISILPTN